MEYFAGLDVSMEETCVSRPMALARGETCPTMRKGPMVFQTSIQCGGRPTERWLYSGLSRPQISAEEIVRRYAISPVISFAAAGCPFLAAPAP
jgi:hypothetical protein